MTYVLADVPFVRAQLLQQLDMVPVALQHGLDALVGGETLHETINRCAKTSGE